MVINEKALVREMGEMDIKKGRCPRRRKQDTARSRKYSRMEL